jgi:hypothetical protein
MTIKGLTNMSSQKKFLLQRSMLAQAIAITSLGLGASQAMAATCTGTLNYPTGSCTLSSSDSLTLTDNGEVNTTNTYNFALHVLAATSSDTFSGSIQNAGQISVLNDDLSSDTYITGNAFTALRLGAGGSGSSVITNSGDIRVELEDDQNVDAESQQLEANAINLNWTYDGAFAGSLENESGGSISASVLIDVHDGSVTGSSLDFTARAKGIWGSALTGAVVNTGEINATARINLDMAGGEPVDVDAEVEATGISFSDNLSGSLVNDGTINVVAGINVTNDTVLDLDTLSAVAHGIYTESDLTGSLINNGQIDVQAFAGGEAHAGGIWVDGDMVGTLTNNGMMSVMVTGGSSADAEGIELSADLIGNLTNAGKINVTGSAPGFVYAWGIRVDNDLVGSLTNAGQINVMAIGGEGGRAFGITSKFTSGTIENTEDGSIYVQASEAVDYAFGISGSLIPGGEHIDLDESGQVINDGSIVVENADYINAGIRFNTIFGNVVNGGSIHAQHVNSYADYNAGIDIKYSFGAIENSGTILAENAEQVAGISVKYNAGTIENSGMITARDAYYVAGIFSQELAENESYEGSITNTADGLINAYSAVYAVGILVPNYVEGDITNQGRIVSGAAIDITANGTNLLTRADFAVGIGVHNLSGKLLNEGEITVLATDIGVGIDGSGRTSGSIINNGRIWAYGGDSAFGMHIEALDYEAELTNNGLIVASESALNPIAVEVHGGVFGQPSNPFFTNSSTGELFGAVVLGESSDYDVDMLNEGQWTLYERNHDLAAHEGSIDGNYTQSGNGLIRIQTEDALVPDDYGRVVVTGDADFSGMNMGSQPFRVVAPDNGYFTYVDNTTVIEDVFTADTYTDRPPVGTDVGNGLWGWEIIENVDDPQGLDFGFTEYRGAANLANALGGAYAGLGGVVDACVADLQADGPEGHAHCAALVGVFGRLDTTEEVQDLLAQASANPNGLAASLNTATATGMVLGDIMGVDGTTGGLAGLGQSALGLAAGDDYEHTYGAWVRPYYIDTDQDRTGNGAWGYDADTTGVLVGADTLLNDCWRVGLGFGYSSTDVDGKDVLSGNHTEAETWQVLAYGKYSYDDRTYLDLLAAYGWSDNDTRRDVNYFIPDNVGTTAPVDDRHVHERLEGDFDSWFAHAEAQLGRTFDLSDCWRLVPELGLAYTHYDQDGYRETGNPLWALDVDDMDEDILTATFDLGTVWDAPVSGYDLLVSAYAGVGYDIIDADNVIGSNFVNGSQGFQSEGVERDEFSVRGGVGVRTVLAEAFDVSLNYDVDGRDDYLSQMGSLNLRYMF